MGTEEECYNFMITLKEAEMLHMVSTKSQLSSTPSAFHCGSFKLMQSFSLTAWRAIEEIVKDKIHVTQLSD